FHDGVISQFEGYGDREELGWEGYRARCGDIARLDRILEAAGDTPNRYRLSKQADVLMLLYLLSPEEVVEPLAPLGYPSDDGLLDRTIEYYRARTSHGSSLSGVGRSWLGVRAGRERSWPIAREALAGDRAGRDADCTVCEGIHLGAMAGSVDLIQRG